MSKVAYKYKWTRRFSVSPQVFGEFYYSLPKRSPEELLRAAKSKSAPVHKLFNWDDKAAAHEHRLLQARVMVNSLQVEIITQKGKPGHVLAFIRSSDRGRHVATLEASREELTEAMQECWRDMLAFRAKYKNLEIASSVIQAIDDVDRRVRRNGRKAA
jgi:hypothetical protein